jgi:hypothetical protein
MPTNRASDALKATHRQTWYSTISAALPAGGATDRLAARFQSFADTVQTRLDTANGTGATLTGSLEAQVDRALSQVLRQPSVGRAGGAADQGPTQLVTQALSVATLLNGSGGPPAIAPRQAALLQEATLIKGDLLSVLDSLQPLSAFPDPSDIAAVTAIVRTEVSMLVEEFSRTTLRPRAQRVRVLLGGLLGWDPINNPAPNLGDVNALLTLLNLGGPLVPTLQLEQQLAGQDVLNNDVQSLLDQWLAFRTATDPATIPIPWETGLVPRLPILSGLGRLGPQQGSGNPFALGPASVQAQFRLAVIASGTTPPPGSYAERLIQADLLLPVVGQDASGVSGALTAIGLSPGEQETTFIDLQSLVDMDILGAGIPAPLAPPPAGSFVPVHTTITDVLDWSAGMADATVTDLVRQAGQLGLNLVADQADELFWLVVAMLYPGAATQMAELGDAQVQTELLTLARDLNLLANLAV